MSLSVDQIIQKHRIRADIQEGFLVFPESVAALVRLPNQRYLLVEQFRGAVGRTTIELPGGKIEAGEDAAQALVREVREETGHDASDPLQIQTLDLDFSSSRHRTHVFLAAASGSPSLVESGMKVHEVSGDRLLELVTAGTITHAPTVFAAMWIASRRP